MKIKINSRPVNIVDVKSGDYIFNYEDGNKSISQIKIIHPNLIQKEEQIKVHYDNGDTLQSSDSHRMLYATENGEEYIPFKDFPKYPTVGDCSKITSIEYNGVEDEIYYDLELDSPHNYFIKSKVSHNSANVSIPFWHTEIEDVLVLKNNAGTDDNRVRKLDYTIQFCKLFYDRLINNEDITLFSPAEAKGLYEAFGDNEEFERLYVKYENAYSIRFKKKIPARKLAEVFARERLETGRIYSMNIDTVNENGAWDIPIKMTNLCVEILHPTVPIQSVEDPDGEIGICVLSALNLIELGSDEDIERSCKVIVNTLDAVIDYQDYPILAGENFTKKRRSLGIGVTNLAGFLAKKKLSYSSPETLPLIHEIMEKIQWHLLNESCKMAEEHGCCEKFCDTKYSKGQLPIDWYKKTVDTLIKPCYNMDWEGLRGRIAEFGLRHSTLTAQMPCESSSVIQNNTNGIEPVRDYLSYKKAKNGVLKQLVPNFYSRRSFYDKAWDFTTNVDILNISAVMQKFIDMGMSTNLYYNYNHYEDGNIPLSRLIKDQIYGYKFGLKNFYYCNTPDSDGETEKDLGCEGGSCSI